MKTRFTAYLCAAALALLAASPAGADTLDELFNKLRDAPSPEVAYVVEDQIWTAWSASGSDAMDLLLERGRQAMQVGDTQTAIAHFTALIDHAPDFAEGWNARATAFYVAGMYGPSMTDIAQTLQREPRHFGALMGLALILEETGQINQALEAYRRVTDINPHADGVADAIGRLERELGVTSL